MAPRISVFSRILVLSIGVGIMAWVAGFVWFFVDSIKPAKLVPTADGIVVLTGGAGRIAPALSLLENGMGRVMLISGMSRNADIISVLNSIPYPLSKIILSKLYLGYKAETTVGNAEETALWIKHNSIHSIIVVTSGYHIRRAMIEMRRELPELQLLAYPVPYPEQYQLSDVRTWRLLIREYNKLLLAVAGLTRSFYIQKFLHRKTVLLSMRYG